ncbi:MAG: S49 family peptidase [Amphiplicatus sp.]
MASLTANKLVRRLPLVGEKRRLVSVIELKGVIGETSPGRRGLTLARVEQAIEAAFKPDRLDAVALAINSPGGSPVQSRLICLAIRRAAQKKGTPVFAFIEDVGASGGYILALAADEIYADASSIVGSIGVIAASFGFQEAIARLGVERRVHAAGSAKSQLDPFRSEDKEDVARLKAVLEDLHRQFIDLVRERRGAKLGRDDDIFTGAYWTAGAAAARGLIDGTAHLADFMRARFGENVKLRQLGPEKPSLLRRLFGGEARGRFGLGPAGLGPAGLGPAGLGPAGLGLIDPGAALAAIEERSMWSRYGL